MNARLMLCLAALATAAPTTRADLPALQPLGTALTGAPGCLHVIDLLNRYGALDGLQRGQGGAVVPSPSGSFYLPAAEMGDLQITNLVESATSDPAGAPTFLVAVTNLSSRSVCDVQIALVALLGPIQPCSPTASATLKEIPAGATIEVAITLPVEALAMGSNGGGVVGFQKLLVAIDAFDRLVESDESNNLRLVCRTDVPRQVIEVAAPVEAAPAPVAPQAAAPAAPGTIDSAIEEFGLETKPVEEAAAERL